MLSYIELSFLKKKTEGVVKENKGVVQGKGETQQKILTSVGVRGYDGRTVQMVVH